ncbi:MAG: cadherin-like beta sandwich domain-containing protein [Planctomycetota bacterium]
MIRSTPSTAGLRCAAGLSLCLLATACGRHSKVASATASELLVVPGTLDPSFDPARTEYTVALPYAESEVTVVARVGAPGSALTVNDIAVASGQPSGPWSLVPGRTDMRVVVSGPQAQSSRTYHVAVERAPGLQDLAASVGVLDPSFDPDVLEYDLTLAAPQLALTAQVAEPGVTLAVDGTLATVGRPYPFDLALGDRTIPVTLTSADGHVERTYTLRVHRVAPTLAQSAYAKAANSDLLDAYGTVVATDGLRMAIGTPLEDSLGDPFNNVAADAGAVYVVERGAAGWQQAAMVKATNAENADMFGAAVAISGDLLVVGAPHESSDARGVNGDKFNNRSPSSGAAYVFVRQGAGYVFQAYLKASNTGDNDRFGSVVAISGDRIAVSAPGEDSGARGVGGAQGDDSVVDSGAVYVFSRVGDQWSQEAYIKATNSGGFDGFGTSLALHDETLVVGAPNEDSAAIGVDGDGDNDATPESGAAYVYRLRNGMWHAEAYLKATNTGTEDLFGTAVAVHGDLIAVGAPGEASAARVIGGDQADDSSPGAGAVYAYRRSGDVWSPRSYVKADNSGRGDAFGAALAFDGTLLAVGAPGEDSEATGIDGDGTGDGARDAGAAYAFVRDGDTWTQRHYLKASNTDAGDGFGFAVAVSGEIALVAAPFEDSAAVGVGGEQANNDRTDAGACYVFAVR